MINGVSATSKVLLDLLANSLFDAKIDIDLQGISLAELYREANAQTVAAIAFDALPQTAKELDPILFVKWQTQSFAIAQKNINQLYANAEVESIFKTAGVPICTIKGFASDYYYSKKNLRHMGDIDFIVPIDQVEKGKEILESNGFKCSDEDEIHDFHIGYKKGNEIYEMHKGITSLLDENGYIEKYIEDIFDNTIAADFGIVNITIPDTFAHGFTMLLHLQRHMMNGSGVGLRHLCDWAAFVNVIDNDEWEKVFKSKLESIKLWNFAKVLSKTSSAFLKINEKPWFADIDDSLAEELLIDIVLGGNFGRKDMIGRYQGGMFMAQNEHEDKKIKIYAKGMARKVYVWKPFYEKHKWLLPIGTIAYLFRTLFLVLFKHKRIDITEAYKSGTTRNALYKKIFK